MVENIIYKNEYNLLLSIKKEPMNLCENFSQEKIVSLLPQLRGY